MGLLDSILGKKRAKNALADTKAAAASTATADPSSAKQPVQSAQSPALGPTNPVVDDAAMVSPMQPPMKLGIFGGLKQKLKGHVDGYVNEKAEEALAMAEQFRTETLEQVKTHAFELLDITEKRIEKKLGEIEKMLDERLQQELRMRLRAMIWTLAFVLLMAIVSIIYVWAKQTAGLNNPSNSKQSTAKP